MSEVRSSTSLSRSLILSCASKVPLRQATLRRRKQWNAGLPYRPIGWSNGPRECTSLEALITTFSCALIGLCQQFSIWSLRHLQGIYICLCLSCSSQSISIPFWQLRRINTSATWPHKLHRGHRSPTRSGTPIVTCSSTLCQDPSYAPSKEPKILMYVIYEVCLCWHVSIPL